MAWKSSTGARAHSKAKRPKHAKRNKPKLTGEAGTTTTLSNEQTRMWVVSWLSRVTGRHIRDADLLRNMPYENDVDLQRLSNSFNAAFKGKVTPVELRSEWQTKDATVSNLVAFLSRKLGALPSDRKSREWKLTDAFASTATSVASNQRVKKFVFSWFKSERGQILNLSDKLSELHFDDDADLHYFTASFDVALDAAVTTPQMKQEFEVKDATVGSLIEFLSHMVP